ncbi:DinB family protein [Priestia koreensis]|uniref:DinB family protein n=1 Tax=Priestia koreensis TaxID=284581 RepID=UPI001F565841|nr:DinB family protein [Priestia koreensis]UNL83632.1 DinB family protein [Priestia koreensis]
MNAVDIILVNAKEIRRRSKKVWTAIPEDKLHWKPDREAMSALEMVRHVLESEHYYHLAIVNRGSLIEFHSPFENRPFRSVQDELAFADSYHQEFLNMIGAFSEEELSTIQIDRSDVGYVRSLGDMLMRIGYHESVHTGQLLQYLRSMDADRPWVWD